jgi:tetraacyldisaccharide 4'-kinase
LLLTTYQQPFTADELMPVGKLRESKMGAMRADAIIVTKSPDILDEGIKALKTSSLKKFCEEEVPVFYSRFEYAEPRGYVKQNFDVAKEIILVSGIGIPEVFEKYGSSAFNVIGIVRFSDHHKYTKSELENICNKNGKAQFLTTEKDFVKINTLLTESQKKRFLYLPVNVSFEDPEAFNSYVLQRFKKYQSS